VANLSVFIFVMTGVVYETQHRTNPNIANYADALYFTVTALTTTGFGDITLPGTARRLITIVVWRHVVFKPRACAYLVQARYGSTVPIAGSTRP
jgi:voltage-gated potassium channel